VQAVNCNRSASRALV